ncbi:hypothetical protein GXM_05508 [Nostoc sphaeroides CCNUC1]|uniref:Uncharacterized protein n=1 Tax=Nostoc sphaeroides CCNUC1 TaxID=2653204 RepID=A0A5P8W6Z0_9NOSO|nr:hypothetical protein GXM_05508 [Nostoc sphaeroides CCNUC1]
MARNQAWNNPAGVSSFFGAIQAKPNRIVFNTTATNQGLTELIKDDISN